MPALDNAACYTQSRALFMLVATPLWAKQGSTWFQ